MRLTRMNHRFCLERLMIGILHACIAGWGGGGIELDPKQIWSSGSIGEPGKQPRGFSGTPRRTNSSKRPPDDGPGQADGDMA